MRKFNVGDSVEALWTDNRYYPASVTSVEIGMKSKLFQDEFGK